MIKEDSQQHREKDLDAKKQEKSTGEQKNLDDLPLVFNVKSDDKQVSKELKKEEFQRKLNNVNQSYQLSFGVPAANVAEKGEPKIEVASAYAAGGDGCEQETESSSDSDFDMIEALESSAELQSYVKRQIKSELAIIGPKIFDKLKVELALE